MICDRVILPRAPLVLLRSGLLRKHTPTYTRLDAASTLFRTQARPHVGSPNGFGGCPMCSCVAGSRYLVDTGHEESLVTEVAKASMSAHDLSHGCRCP